MLHPTLAEDEKILKRFRAEARAPAKLENPNIVIVFDLQETESGLCIAMQYVEGANLAARLQNGPLPLAEALPIIKQLLKLREKFLICSNFNQMEMKPLDYCLIRWLDMEMKSVDPAPAVISL